MRISAFIALCLLFLSVGLSAKDNRVSPIIKEVTVYRSGAKLSSEATVRVAAGKSEVIFENLSPYFNSNSLQVKIKGSANLLSAAFRMRVPGPVPENPRTEILRDSIVLLGDALTALRDERQVLEAEQQLIENNMAKIGITTPGPNPQTNLSLNELKEMAAFYRQRQMEIKDLLLKLLQKERKITKNYAQNEENLRKLYPNTANQTGEIVLFLESESAQNIEIICTYLVTEAGWSPLYDLRAEGIGKPLQMVYKANVSNRSGFDWKGVMLHLSTANPLINNERPVMTPLFVDFRPIVAYRWQNDDTKKKDVAVYQLAQSNMKQESAPRDMMRSAPAGAAEEAEISDELLGIPPENNDDLVANFDLPKPQDIAADGVENIVSIKEEAIPADYEYHAVPKIDPAVFLLAKVTNYGKYNLLPGIANIFYQDTYIGQTSINPRVTSDTMLISLGRDEQINIKRVQPQDFTERKKILSSSIKELYTYEIVVKNNKSIPVRVEILDQIPVSRQADIKVELEDKDGAVYSEENGKLKWELDIPAGQNKRVRFTYSVKYPKDKPIQLMRS